MGLYIVTTLLNEFGATITLDHERNQYGNLYKFIITFPDEEV
jgi:ATPase, histidine kinase-, DNA gyrase B-, and HSP90-like domain protein protein